MWIRSQKGEQLVNANSMIRENNCIYAWYMSDHSRIKVGEYKTVERAEEEMIAIHSAIARGFNVYQLED